MQSLDLEVLTHMREWLAGGRSAWLVTVTQTFGASPRPPGSLMAMRDDGIVVGSVSGGCIEDDLVARRAEFSGKQPILQSYGVSAEEARRFGLPCGGQLEVVIESSLAAAALDVVCVVDVDLTESLATVTVLDAERGLWGARTLRLAYTDDTPLCAGGC